MFEKLIISSSAATIQSVNHSALPFTQDGMSYRVCLKCGTRIAFSVEDFKYITAGYRDANAGRRARLGSAAAWLFLKDSNPSGGFGRLETRGMRFHRQVRFSVLRGCHLNAP